MTTRPIAIAAAFAAAYGSTAHADAWQILDQIEIEEIVTETSYEVRKTFPEALQQGALDVEITGYAVPALPGEAIRELILVSDMGLCPLCGSAEHGASLQITLADPIETFDESRRMTLRGALTPVTDPETWQSAILENATILVE
ncbi:hypothetical protein NBRC116590_08510 [Pelagimonas sp. KU-00592-HH]|uniref:hypothetical protein n=1 Tax=Roseobacteraceae TaxID=2854170 RepID=UPI0020CE39F6|nr:hypothetical protein [Shimia sp. CNT1-13L.2]MCP9481202.1 hypothetical protein [Shimia sp. CNT1-13L.2]